MKKLFSKVISLYFQKFINKMLVYKRILLVLIDLRRGVIMTKILHEFIDSIAKAINLEKVEAKYRNK
jgi:hypothetical protein